MKKFFPVLLGACASLLPFGEAGAAIVYRPGEGWTTESEYEDVGPAEKDSISQMNKAEAYERDGDTDKALAAYRQLVRKWPNSRLAPKAQLKVGELSEREGDYDRAFKEFGKYIKNYQKGEDFEEAVAAQYRIAMLFLEGERRKLLGLKTLPSMARAEEMLTEIVKTAPYSKVAPRAQFSAGLAQEKQGKNDEAVATYQEILVKYPNDPVAADAQYQIGYVYLAEARQGSYDPKAAMRAREAFEDFVARYPDSEKVPQANENIELLSGKRTRGSMEIAEFYDKQKNYKAAAVYYNEVIRLDPDSEESARAKERLEELRSIVGEDALKFGTERAETGERAASRRKLAAEVDTVSRPDYVGPPIVVPEITPPPKPKLRTSPDDVGPIPAVEPPLPTE